MSRKLTLADISDLRAYEQQRDATLERIIELKRARRVQVGELISFVFENRDTVWFQVQEIARAERMLRDDQVESELAIYNPLVPKAGELSTTMLIELRSEQELREWLPKLAGVERSVVLRVGAEKVPGTLDELHAESLTRDTMTASVHYLRFRLTAAQVEAFEREEVALTIEHPSYEKATTLSSETKASLLNDLRPDA